MKQQSFHHERRGKARYPMKLAYASLMLLVSLGKHSDITVTSNRIKPLNDKRFRAAILLKMYKCGLSHARHPHGVSYFSQLLHVYIYFTTLITNIFWFNNFSHKSSTIFCAKPLEEGSTGEAVYRSHFHRELILVAPHRFKKLCIARLHLLLLNQDQILS